MQSCQPEESCLLYQWRKSQTETALLRQCFPSHILLGPVHSPLRSSSTCNLKDITDDQEGTVKACLCNTDLCNDEESQETDKPSDPYVVLRTTSVPNLKTSISEVKTLQEVPRQGHGLKVPGEEFESIISAESRLECHSCGSLLFPDKKCQVFNGTDPTQRQECLEDEACLMYSWKKSNKERGI